MSDQPGKGLTVYDQSRGGMLVSSKDDLYEILTDVSNFSALKHNLGDDQWPDFSPEDPEIREIVEDLQTQIDPNDLSSIDKFGSSIIDKVRELHSGMISNAAFSGLFTPQKKSKETTIALDYQAMVERLKPLMITDEELNPGWFARNVLGEKKRERPSPHEVEKALTRLEMDLSAFEVAANASARKTDREIARYQQERKILIEKQDEIPTYDIQLYVAYLAAHEILMEWHSEEVLEAYVGQSQHFDIPSSKTPDDIKFDMPRNATAWALATAKLNNRMETLRSDHMRLVQINARMQDAIDQIEDSEQLYSVAANGNPEDDQEKITLSQGTRIFLSDALKQMRDALQYARIKQRIDSTTLELAEVKVRMAMRDEKRKIFEDHQLVSPAQETEVTKSFKGKAEKIRANFQAAADQDQAKVEQLETRIEHLSEVRDGLLQKLDPEAFELSQNDLEAEKAMNAAKTAENSDQKPVTVKKKKFMGIGW